MRWMHLISGSAEGTVMLKDTVWSWVFIILVALAFAFGG